MTELWILEQSRTRQRFCSSVDQALEDARAALEQGSSIQIIPGREYEDTP